jgi:hypothetical protein
MIKITRTTHYWLFEPTGSHYYVRTATDGQAGYNWFMGHESPAGCVARVGDDLPDEKILELEKRFQDMAKMVNV